MPRGLKIINRADVALYDSAQTAGVDYVDEDKEYNDEEEESKEKIE